MSNIILQSGENSSLIQTLANSDSKRNPSIYNTKEVYPNSAVTWINIPSQNDVDAKSGASQTFALPKYGILTQVLLSVEKTLVRAGNAVADTASYIPAGDIFKMIDRVEFLSSSRVLSTLYSADLMAQYSNLSSDMLNPIVYTSMRQEDVGQDDGDKAIAKFTIPIVFGFNQDINTNMNLTFNENSQIRVVWADVDDRATVNTAEGEDEGKIVAPVTDGGYGTLNTSCGPPSLMLRYQLYGESDTAEMLASNFSSEQLNCLTTRMYRENPETFKGPADDKDITVSLLVRNIDVAQAFYIICKPARLGNGLDASPNVLIEIESVTIEASVQIIAQLDRNASMYSRLTENGYAINALRTGNTETNPIGLENCFKIQCGLWEHATAGPWSNGYSLREMNNVVVKAHFSAGVLTEDVNYDLFVEEECSTVISINSATGRVVNALSN